MKSNIYYLHCLSSLHVGTGQGCGVIDQPITREQASKLPHIPGSGVKGVLRYELEGSLKERDAELFYALFGPESSAAEHAGALAVGDARLLALPVRSWRGGVAWATCPMVLHRYKRDLETVKAENIPATIPLPPNDQTALTPKQSKLVDNGKIYLEDLDLECDENTEQVCSAWADFLARQFFITQQEWLALFKERFIVLSDNLFDFLSETATEIRARIRIDKKTRTVQSGALWYEEYLPAETLLWGIVASDRSRRKGKEETAEMMLKTLPAKIRLQIGGNATTGGGQVNWLRQES